MQFFHAALWFANGFANEKLVSETFRKPNPYYIVTR